MNPKAIAISALFALCPLLAPDATPQPSANPPSAPRETEFRRPERILWIVLDSLRADHLHYAGYERETSPWLDQLAKESVDFRWAIAPGDMTHISVPAYFAGKLFSELYANPLGNQGRWLPDWPDTIAEVLADTGFHTEAWTANPRTTSEAGFAQGFQEFHEIIPFGAPTAKIGEIIEAVEREYKPSGGRELLYVHLMDTHLPYRPPVPYDRAFVNAYDRDVVREGALLDRHGRQVVSNRFEYAESQDVQAEDVAFLISQYDGAIRHVDAMLPALLQALCYEPQHDLIVIHADHGEQFFERGFWGHGYGAHPEETHVPLLMRYPAFTPRVVESPISLMDLYATFCEWFGAPVPEGLRSVSLLPELRGEGVASRYVVTEGYDFHGPRSALIGNGFYYWISTDIWRLEPWHVWPHRECLFDLRDDPQALHDLSKQQPELADTMNAALRYAHPRWANATPDQLRGTENEIRFGPDLLTSPGTLNTWQLHATEIEAAPDGPVTITAPPAAVTLTLDATDTLSPHLLEVEYSLDAGVLALEARNVHKQLYYHEFWKPTEGRQLHRAVILPREAHTELLFRMDQPGCATLHHVRMRRVHAPAIDLVPYTTPGQEAQPPAAPITDADKARLEALGYLE